MDSATGTIHLKATFDNEDGSSVAGPVRHFRADARHHTGGHALCPPKPYRPGSRASSSTSSAPDNKVAIRVVTAGRAFGKKDGNREGHRAPAIPSSPTASLRLFPGAEVQLVDPAKLDAGKS